MKTAISFRIAIYIDDSPVLEKRHSYELSMVGCSDKRITELLEVIAPPTMSVSCSAVVNELSRVTEGRATAALDRERPHVKSFDGWGSNYLDRE